MPSLSYLHTKNGRHYVRIRIPQSLRPWLDQHEIRWSLHTGCLKTARQHLLIANVLINELFEQARMEIAHTPLSDLEKIKIKSQIERIKLEKLEQFRALIGQHPQGAAQAQQILHDEQTDIAAFQSALDADHFDEGLVKSAASNLVEVVPRLGYEFSALNPNYNFLAREFCRGMVWQHEAKSKLLRGLVSHRKTSPIVIQHFHNSSHPHHAEAKQHSDETPSAPKVSEMVRSYLDDLISTGTQDKTIHEYQAVFERFVEFTHDAPVSDIKSKDFKAFRDSLKSYPARLLPKQKGMNFQQLIESSSKSTLGEASINKHLTRLSQLYRWAARNDFPVKHDAADGHAIKDKRRERDQRDRYSHDDIGLVFSTSNYQGEKAFARTAYYWAPLIALHSGMRIEEICQLRVRDVRLDKDSNIYIFDINDDDPDRKLKPGQSTMRTIPVHPKLKELGFIEYVDSLRFAKHRMIFPTLTRHDLNGYSHAVSKWFSQHKSDLGLGPKLTFHSFRHTVADTLKQASVDENIINAIMGHTGGSLSITRYGKDYKPGILLAAIEKLDFEIPAKSFSKCRIAPAERQALRSAKNADALKEKRLAPYTTHNESKD